MHSRNRELGVRTGPFQGSRGRTGVQLLAYQKRKFSHDLIRAVYPFYGTQVAGAGTDLRWAIENDGLMHHSQSMERNNDGTTANVCGVGATFIIRSTGSRWR